MKIPVFINGLLPNTRDVRAGNDGGSRVYVRITKGYLPQIKEILTSDENGEVRFTISDDYAGAAYLVRVRHRWYKGVQTSGVVKDYGLFYTAKISHDFTFWADSPSPDPEWQPEVEYADAASRMADTV